MSLRGREAKQFRHFAEAKVSLRCPPQLFGSPIDTAMGIASALIVA